MLVTQYDYARNPPLQQVQIGQILPNGILSEESQNNKRELKTIRIVPPITFQKQTTTKQDEPKTPSESHRVRMSLYTPNNHTD